MSKYKVEIKITGEITKYALALEGEDVRLQENPEHVYTRTYTSFIIEEPLEFSLIMHGVHTTKWAVEMKINDVVKLSEKGVFPKKKMVSMFKQISLP